MKMKKKWWLIILIIGIALITYYSVDASLGSRLKDIDYNQPQTRYLLFPTGEDGGLKRALLVSGKELAEQDLIGYYTENKENFIPKKQLTLYPPASAEVLVQALNDEIATWGNYTDYQKIYFTHKAPFVVLTIINLNGKKQKFYYQIESASQPKAVKIYSPL